MTSLYYLIASLPALLFDKEPAINYQKFLYYAEAVLTEDYFARLKAFNLQEPPLSMVNLKELEKNYWQWDISLKNDLVELRAEARGIDINKYKRPSPDMGTKNLALTAFRESNPLKVERQLDIMRFNLLEDSKNGDYFSFNSLLIYGMQLQILERRMGFKADVGRKRYDEEYESILKDVKEVLAENI
ncbi:MAG: DUF2764 family protein [Spirochaetaceae bacterium]|nr:DUF2764 family protein [Spirochaetaceae bacterium]